MGAGIVHYEVFARRKAGGEWTLQQATETRALAIETAETLLVERRAAAVKVCKETLDEATGQYASLAILTRGDLSQPKAKKAAGPDDGLLCVAPADLYSAHARERIGRLLEGWLLRVGVTTFELLHRADLVERLDASGLEIQHALQKISIPEAQSHQASVHEIIRRYRKLTDDAIARVMADHRRHLFPEIGPGGLAAAVEKAQAAETPTYALGGAVAASLADDRGWLAKLVKLLDLADAAPAAGPGRALAFRVLEQPLGEILGSKAGVAALVGEASPDPGAGLTLMARLAAPDAVEALVARDAVLGAEFPPCEGVVARLAKWLAEPAFEAVRAALARRMLAELNSQRRLRPHDAVQEIQTMRALARVLIMAGARIVSPEDVQSAFLERSRSLLNPDFVEVYLEQSGGGPLGEAQALLRLAENVVGGANKLAAARWLKSVASSLRFERDLMHQEQSASWKLAHLAELTHALQRTGLAEEDRAEITGLLGELGALIEADAKLVHAIAHASVTAPQRLMLLLRLASGEAAPQGPVCGRARAEALRLVRDPAARSQLAGAPEVVARAHDLLTVHASAA